MLTIRQVRCTGEGVSWTAKPFDYFIHTVDSRLYIYMYSYIYIYMCMYTCSIRKEDRICASYRAKKCPSENWAEAEGVDQESLSSKHSSLSHFNRLSSPLLCTAAVCSQISLHNKESGALSLPAHHLLALLQHRRLPHLVL